MVPQLELLGMCRVVPLLLSLGHLHVFSDNGCCMGILFLHFLHKFDDQLERGWLLLPGLLHYIQLVKQELKGGEPC